MAVKPKIYTKHEIDKLSHLYLDEKMSTVDIEKNSEKEFGKYISRGTIYKALIKYKINVRNKSDSVHRAMSTLDIDKTFINEDIIEWVDGFLLGDGSINFKRNKNFQNSRFSIGSSSKLWVDFSMKKFKKYDYREPKIYQKIDEKHPNPIWDSKTKSHPDIVKQAKRWYSGKNESKVVPEDVRITPASVLLWYLGDGSFTYTSNNSGMLRLATCSFSNSEINDILIPKLKDKEIDCTKDNIKNDIFIYKHNIRNFFNFIGWESPFEDYSHKFNVPDWLKLYRLSELVNNNKDKWKVQYWCKTNKIGYSKSPKGGYLLFDKKQVKCLRDKLKRIEKNKI